MLNEILVNLGLNEVSETAGFKCTVFGDKGVYIEGITRIVKFGEEEIILKVSRNKAVITGKSLKLKNMTECDAVISGKIDKVELVEDKIIK